MVIAWSVSFRSRWEFGLFTVGCLAGCFYCCLSNLLVLELARLEYVESWHICSIAFNYLVGCLAIQEGAVGRAVYDFEG